MISRYDYLALPVVSDDRHMLGVITVDDVIDVIVEETGGHVLTFGAAEAGGVLNQPYFRTDVLGCYALGAMSVAVAVAVLVVSSSRGTGGANTTGEGSEWCLPGAAGGLDPRSSP